MWSYKQRQKSLLFGDANPAKEDKNSSRVQLPTRFQVAARVDTRTLEQQQVPFMESLLPCWWKARKLWVVLLPRPTRILLLQGKGVQPLLLPTMMEAHNRRISVQPHFKVPLHPCVRQPHGEHQRQKVKLVMSNPSLHLNYKMRFYAGDWCHGHLWVTQPGQRPGGTLFILKWLIQLFETASVSSCVVLCFCFPMTGPNGAPSCLHLLYHLPYWEMELISNCACFSSSACVPPTVYLS